MDGTFIVGIEPAVRAWIVEMAEALEETIGTDNPDIRRLFPTAYPHDPERDAGYQIFARGEQIERKHTAIETMRATVDAKTFTADELSAWMGIINDLRLVLGTRLDVSEDDRKIKRSDPNAEAHHLYRQLGLIMEYMVDALSYNLESLANFLPALIDGQASAVVNLFDDDPEIFAERGGLIVGSDATKAWAREATVWFNSMSATVETTAIISTETCVVHNAVLWITVDDQQIDMPCVVVGERPSSDDGFTTIRIYHSTWPYLGTTTGRITPLDRSDTLEIPQIVSKFLRSLEAKDHSAIQAMFSDEGRITPPTGQRFAVQAKQAEDEFYRQHLGPSHASYRVLAVVDDGIHCAFEYEISTAGTTTAGAGVVERATDDLIAAMVMVDNAVEPPIDIELQ